MLQQSCIGHVWPEAWAFAEVDLQAGAPLLQLARNGQCTYPNFGNFFGEMCPYWFPTQERGFYKCHSKHNCLVSASDITLGRYEFLPHASTLTSWLCWLAMRFTRYLLVVAVCWRWQKYLDGLACYRMMCISSCFYTGAEPHWRDGWPAIFPVNHVSLTSCAAISSPTYFLLGHIEFIWCVC